MSITLTETQVRTLARKGVRETGAIRLKDDDLDFSRDVAIDIIGTHLVESDPQKWIKRVSLHSDFVTHIFDVPDDFYRLLWVKDLGVKAGMITGATNASPIVITENNHSRQTGDIVTIHDVTGNTSANGTWKVTRLTASTYSLYGSTGNGDYTATQYGYLYDEDGDYITDSEGNPISSWYGGKAFKDSEDHTLVYQRPTYDASNQSSFKWYARGNSIVIDDPTYDNDIVIGYIYKPTALSEIESEFHHAIVSYIVIDNIEFPNSDDPKFPDYKMSFERHQNRWNMAIEKAKYWKFAFESRNLNTSSRVTRSYI